MSDACLQSIAGILTGGVVGGIVGGLLLLVGAIFLCVVLVKGVVVRRNWKTYSTCVSNIALFVAYSVYTNRTYGYIW